MAGLPFWEWGPTPQADHWDSPLGSAWDSCSSLGNFGQGTAPLWSQFPHFKVGVNKQGLSLAPT